MNNPEKTQIGQKKEKKEAFFGSLFAHAIFYSVLGCLFDFMSAIIKAEELLPDSRLFQRDLNL